MHLRFLKKLMAYSALLALVACGGGSSGGGSDDGTGGSGSGSNGLPLAITLTLDPQTTVYVRNEASVSYEFAMPADHEIPASIFTVVNQDGSTRLATMSDLYFIEDTVVKTATGFTLGQGEGVTIVPIDNAADSWKGGTFHISSDIEPSKGNFDNQGTYREFGVLLQSQVDIDSSYQPLLIYLQNHLHYNNDVRFTRGIAAPLGATMTLRQLSYYPMPESIACPELGIDWTLGESAPVLSTEGECELVITLPAQYEREPVRLPFSVYGELESIRLDAGFDVDGTATLLPRVYNPYKVVGVSKSGMEINLSAFYDVLNSSSSGVTFNLNDATVSVYSSSGELPIGTVEMQMEAVWYEEVNNYTDTPARALLGLPEGNISLSTNIRKLDRLELGQTHYFAAVGDPIPTPRVTGIIGNQRFDLNVSEGFAYKDNVTNHEKTLMNGTVKTNIYTVNYSNESQKGFELSLEVGDLTLESLKGRWQYLDDGATRIIGSHTATPFDTQTEVNTLRETNSGRYLVRAGIPNVAVTAATSLVGEGTASNNTASGVTRAIKTRSIGGGNLIFKNVDTGESHEVTVNPDDGSVDTTLPTGDYSVSREVQVEENGTLVTYTLFDAPAVVEGQAVELGTFSAVGSGTPNFKAEIRDNDFIYYPGQSYSKTIVVTNVGSSAQSGLDFFVEPDTSSASLFQAHSQGDAFGGVSAGNTKEFTFNFTPQNSGTEHQTAKIEVRVTNGVDTWYDHVYIDVSHVSPINLNLHASTGTNSAGFMNGYLLTPGRKLIHINVEGSSGVNFKVPNEDNAVYQMIFVNQDVDQESAYGVGVGATIARANVDGYKSNGGSVTKNEPTDNTPEGAIQLYRNDQYLSYMGANDIDYVDINLSDAP